MIDLGKLYSINTAAWLLPPRKNVSFSLWHTWQFRERATVVEPLPCCSWWDQCCFRCSDSWSSSYLSGAGALILTFALRVSVYLSFQLSAHQVFFVLIYSYLFFPPPHPPFPMRSPCCGAIQQELVATPLSTSLSLFQRRPDLCWSRWASDVLLLTSVILYLLSGIFLHFYTLYSIEFWSHSLVGQR